VNPNSKASLVLASSHERERVDVHPLVTLVATEKPEGRALDRREIALVEWLYAVMAPEIAGINPLLQEWLSPSSQQPEFLAFA